MNAIMSSDEQVRAGEEAELAIAERLLRRGKPISEGHPDHDGGRYTYAPLVNPDGPDAAAIIKELVDAVASIREHCEPQPSALAKAIVATCDSALNRAGAKQ